MLQPPTPPPMITTWAWVGTLDAMEGLLEPCFPLRIADPLRRPLEVLFGVPAEIEIQAGNPALQEPPHGLPHVRSHSHQPQARQPGRIRPAGVGLQQPA